MPARATIFTTDAWIRVLDVLMDGVKRRFLPQPSPFGALDERLRNHDHRSEKRIPREDCGPFVPDSYVPWAVQHDVRAVQDFGGW
jgi:hypothetical protein